MVSAQKLGVLYSGLCRPPHPCLQGASVFEMKFRERCPRNGYDAKTGHYTGPTISHVLEKLVKLVEKGVVEKVPDESFGYRYRLKK